MGGNKQGHPMPIHEHDAANLLGAVRLAPKLKEGDLSGWVSRSEVEMKMQIDQRKCAVRQRMCGFPPNSFLWTGTQAHRAACPMLEFPKISSLRTSPL